MRLPRGGIDSVPIGPSRLWVNLTTVASLGANGWWRKRLVGSPAVSLANDTVYRPGASIFGEPEEARALAGRLEGGRIAINEGPLYVDPHLPVGGIKDSGLYGCTYKIQELVYAKRVHVGG